MKTIKLSVEKTKEEILEELDIYLKDFDNLKDCGFMKNPAPIDEYVFTKHKGMDLNDFLSKGREFLRLYIMELKSKNE